MGKRKVLSPRALRGKMSKAKGIRNENLTVGYVLSHAELFGVPDKEHIYITPRGTTYHKDLFSTAYTKPDGKVIQIGFDLCCISTSDNAGVIVSLIQVKSTKLPPKWYIDVLRNFPVASGVKKYLFLWKDNESEPEIILLN